MKAILVNVIAAGSLMVAGSAFATDMPDLAKKNGCTACHKIEGKLVGPSWKEVSDKYKGDGAAAAHLDTKIAKGGAGVWGSMPMPGNPKLSDADRKALVDYVLGLAK